MAMHRTLITSNENVPWQSSVSSIDETDVRLISVWQIKPKTYYKLVSIETNPLVKTNSLFSRMLPTFSLLWEAD